MPQSANVPTCRNASAMLCCEDRFWYQEVLGLLVNVIRPGQGGVDKRMALEYIKGLPTSGKDKEGNVFYRITSTFFDGGKRCKHLRETLVSNVIGLQDSKVHYTAFYSGDKLSRTFMFDAMDELLRCPSKAGGALEVDEYLRALLELFHRNREHVNECCDAEARHVIISTMAIIFNELATPPGERFKNPHLTAAKAWRQAIWRRGLAWLEQTPSNDGNEVTEALLRQLQSDPDLK
jgi:hypothetical protein